MKRLLLAGTLVLCLSMHADASVVFFGQEDVSAEGYGDAHRLLTMQNNGNETGFMTPPDVVHGDAISGADKSATPSLSDLGWTSGSAVFLAFNVNQTGTTGITLNTMGFNVFDASNNVVATFQLASPFQITPAMAKEDEGNGKGAILFNLDLAQQTVFDALVTLGGTGLTVGAFGSWGCADTQSATCMASNDGADSLLGGTPVNPVPLPATVWLFGGALALFGSLKTWVGRRRKQGSVSLLGTATA